MRVSSLGGIRKPRRHSGIPLGPLHEKKIPSHISLCPRSFYFSAADLSSDIDNDISTPQAVEFSDSSCDVEGNNNISVLYRGRGIFRVFQVGGGHCPPLPARKWGAVGGPMAPQNPKWGGTFQKSPKVGGH